jgi:hypothetical protein
MKMPAVRTSGLSDRVSDTLLGRNIVLIECADVTNDFATEQPEIVHVSANGSVTQTTTDELFHEGRIARRIPSPYGLSRCIPIHRSGHSGKSGQMSSGVFI